MPYGIINMFSIGLNHDLFDEDTKYYLHQYCFIMSEVKCHSPDILWEMSNISLIKCTWILCILECSDISKMPVS